VPITPYDSTSSPEHYAAVTPLGTGPAQAPYDIQAPLEDLTAIFDAANAVAGAGVLYPQGPRQAEAEAILVSPQGAGLDGQDVTAGYTDRWPNNPEPGG
jgi:hypothetical protein